MSRTEDVLLVSAPDVEAEYKNTTNWVSYIHLDNVLVVPVNTFFRNQKFFEGIRVSNIYATQEAKSHPNYPEIKEILQRSKAFSEPREPRIQLLD